jgi:hypothetical protein
MKQSKDLATIVESTKIECYYFKVFDLKALFEVYYKINNIYIGVETLGEYDWRGIDKFNIPNKRHILSNSNDYTEWSDRLTDMYNNGAIPAGIYLIETD